jgi:two-component system, LytTR family, response regulator LytT
MNILIIEDENKTAELLKEFIEENEHCLVVNICQSIENTVKYLTKNQSKLDLIFMDIQLADGESFEIFNQIEVTKPVVFCTAFDKYMLKAFKNNGIGYILKPFQQKDIDIAISKVALIKSSFSNIGNLVQETNPTQKSYQNSFIVRFREKMIPLAVEDIALFQLENEVVYAYEFNGKRSAIFKTINEIENAIDPKIYFRINRQMIINRKAIKNIEPFFNRKIIVNLTVLVKNKPIVSRLKVTPFKKWIENPR